MPGTSPRSTRLVKGGFASVARDARQVAGADWPGMGIVNADGTPAGMIGYESDTVLPPVVVTDAEGRIVYADQTDNYRVRPTPDTVLAALHAAGLATATVEAGVNG